MSERKGDWIQTFTGIAFWPMDPRPEEIDIRDIAHALSMQCRYGGHTKHFYSVAEHCVTLSMLVPDGYEFAALMHDAAEAYLVDVPRPIKNHLGGYRDIEKSLEAVIMPRFGLSFPIADIVMEYDTRMLAHEREQLMATPPQEWQPIGEPLPGRVFGFSPEAAETRFLRRFAELTS